MVAIRAIGWLRVYAGNLVSSATNLEGSSRAYVWGLVVALRPAHWVKNLLLATPLVFGRADMSAALAASLTIGFVAMCCAASAGYLVNDFSDRAADRSHPDKSRRPIAAGQIGGLEALTAAAVLAVCALGLSATFLGPVIAALIAIYLVATIAYTVFLKKLPFIDVTLLAGLYVWRMVVGGEIAGLELSSWMIVFAYTLFIALALVKRIDELSASPVEQDDRLPGRPYGRRQLVGLRAACIVLALVSIGAAIAYIGFSEAAKTYYGSRAWLGVAAVLLGLWIARIIRLANAGRLRGDPVLFSASDPISLGLGVGMAMSLIAAM